MSDVDTDRSSQSVRRAGFLLIAGVIVIIIANINPIVAVYTEPDLLTGMAMIARNWSGWVLQQSVFLTGLLLTTGGLVVLGIGLRTTAGERLARVALIGVIAATSIWVVISAIRVMLPAAEIHESADIPPLFVAAMNGWLFQSFNWLMLGSLALYGGALLQSGWPRWVGLTTIILSGLMLGAFSFFGDGPSEMLCAVTLIVGIATLRRGVRPEARRQPA
jgi:hypothetical protein